MNNRNIVLGALSCIFALALFFTACQKEVIKSSSPNSLPSNNLRDVDGAILRQEMLKFGVADQRVFFENLTGEEKVALWQDKMNSTMNAVEWTDPQMGLLLDLNDEINVGIWVVSSEEETYFLNYLSHWLDDAKNEFSNDQLGWILATADDYVPEGPWANPNTDDCDCSVTDDWCPGSSVCNQMNCNTSAHGCGTFWVKSCRGECGL